MKILRSIHLLLMLWFCIGSANASEIVLREFLQQVREYHPYLTQADYNERILLAQQQQTLGDDDWVLNLNTTLSHTEQEGSSPTSPERANQFDTEVSLQRSFRDSGADLSFGYSNAYRDLDFSPFPGQSVEQFNGVNVSYRLPLLRNRAGALSQQAYDELGFQARAEKLDSEELQESLLLDFAQQLVDIALLKQQVVINRERLELAEQQLERVARKHRAGLVDPVDLRRAEASVAENREQLVASSNKMLASQTKLQKLTERPVGAFVERFDLLTLPSVDDKQDIGLTSRTVAAIDARLQRLDRSRAGIVEERKSNLDLVLQAGLQSSDEDFQESTEFDQPQYAVGIRYSVNLGQRANSAQQQQLAYQKNQLLEQRLDLLRQFRASAESIRLRLASIRELVDLNQARVDLARNKTEAEVRRYQQGRNDLVFVIQSQDDERQTRLALIANAAEYYRLYLQYIALADQLVQSDS